MRLRCALSLLTHHHPPSTHHHPPSTHRHQWPTVDPLLTLSRLTSLWQGDEKVMAALKDQSRDHQKMLANIQDESERAMADAAGECERVRAKLLEQRRKGGDLDDQVATLQSQLRSSQRQIASLTSAADVELPAAVKRAQSAEARVVELQARVHALQARADFDLDTLADEFEDFEEEIIVDVIPAYESYAAYLSKKAEDALSELHGTATTSSRHASRVAGAKAPLVPPTSAAKKARQDGYAGVEAGGDMGEAGDGDDSSQSQVF